MENKIIAILPYHSTGVININMLYPLPPLNANNCVSYFSTNVRPLICSCCPEYRLMDMSITCTTLNTLGRVKEKVIHLDNLMRSLSLSVEEALIGRERPSYPPHSRLLPIYGGLISSEYNDYHECVDETTGRMSNTRIKHIDEASKRAIARVSRRGDISLTRMYILTCLLFIEYLRIQSNVIEIAESEREILLGSIHSITHSVYSDNTCISAQLGEGGLSLKAKLPNYRAVRAILDDYACSDIISSYVLPLIRNYPLVDRSFHPSIVIEYIFMSPASLLYDVHDNVRTMIIRKREENDPSWFIADLLISLCSNTIFSSVQPSPLSLHDVIQTLSEMIREVDELCYWFEHRLDELIRERRENEHTEVKEKFERIRELIWRAWCLYTQQHVQYRGS